jgi:hypothetical protein
MTPYASDTQRLEVLSLARTLRFLTTVKEKVLQILVCHPHHYIRYLNSNSTEGNVSHTVPGLHSMFAIETPADCGCHQHSFTTATGTDESYKRAMTTGALLARTGLDLLIDDEFYTTVRQEWEDDKRARGEEF